MVSQKKQYKRNFLTSVIFRIDFTTIADLNSIKVNPKNFEEKIKGRFPILQLVQQFGVEIEKNPKTLDVEKKINPVWIFKTEDEKEIIELEARSLVVHSKKYSTYNNFKQLVLFALNIFFSSYPSTVTKRMGLRYIDQIKIDEEDFFNWEKYIDSNLIANLNFIIKKEEIKRAMSTLALSIDDESSLSFKYGIFNRAFPNKVVQKEFILDCDCFTHIQLKRTEEIVGRIDKFNKIATEFFEKSITEELRKLLNK